MVQGRRPLESTAAIMELIELHWDKGPSYVLDLVNRTVRPLSMAGLRNYYNIARRSGNIKEPPYTRLNAWSGDDVATVRKLAEEGMNTAEIARRLGVRRHAVRVLCSANSITVRG